MSEKEGRALTCIQSDYIALAVRTGTAPTGAHLPGTLRATVEEPSARKALWLEVGGYSEVYETWGYEDVDVQWKLEQRCPVGQIPDKDRFRVLHLDHDKSYFSPQHNADNQRRFQERKLDPTGAIAHDKACFNATQS